MICEIGIILVKMVSGDTQEVFTDVSFLLHKKAKINSDASSFLSVINPDMLGNLSRILSNKRGIQVVFHIWPIYKGQFVLIWSTVICWRRGKVHISQ